MFSGHAICAQDHQQISFVTGDQFLKDVDESTTATMSQDAPAEAKEFERSLLSEPGNPKDKDLVRAWDELTNLYEDNVFQDKRTVAFISHRASGTQAWVSRDEKEKKVCVHFGFFSHLCSLLPLGVLIFRASRHP